MFFVSDAVWRWTRHVSQAGNVRAGGGEHAYDVETNHTFIYGVVSTGLLFDVVAWIGSCHERCNDPAQDAGHCQPERNILNDLRPILLAADMDIPSSVVETTRQRYITLCIQLGKFNLLRMCNPLPAVLNVVDLLKYWHMNYDAECSQASSSQTGSWPTASYRCHSSSDVCNILPLLLYVFIGTLKAACVYFLFFSGLANNNVHYPYACFPRTLYPFSYTSSQVRCPCITVAYASHHTAARSPYCKFNFPYFAPCLNPITTSDGAGLVLPICSADGLGA